MFSESLRYYFSVEAAVSLQVSVPAWWISGFLVMAVSEKARIYSPLDMTHTQPSMALVMSVGEEAPLNQLPAHK